MVRAAERELPKAQRRATEEADPGSARRAVELLEILGRGREAAEWWRRAADGGDRDAVDYVREYLPRSGRIL